MGGCLHWVGLWECLGWQGTSKLMWDGWAQPSITQAEGSELRVLSNQVRMHALISLCSGLQMGCYQLLKALATTTALL